MSTEKDTEFEYVTHSEDHHGEMTFGTRHEAVGWAAIVSRIAEKSFTVDARQTTEPPMHEDALWYAEVIDKSGDEWESHGHTFLYETRSFAADAGYLYKLANHLDEASVGTNPWYGEDFQQVGTLDKGDDEYPVYAGRDSEGEPLDHGANVLQYREFINDLSYETIGTGDE